MATLFWEDLALGPLAACGPRVVTADEIRAFGAAFDPQEMHVGGGATTGNMVEGLFASGWHSCAIMMRLISDGFLGRTAFMGGAGCDEIKWLAPVRPGDRLTVRPQVLELRESRLRADAGFAKFLFDVVNQNDESVMRVIAHLLFARRPPESAAAHGPTGIRGR